MHGTVCIGDAVNYNHPLTRGLVTWWMSLPNQQQGVIFRDLCRRYDGTLTNGPLLLGPRFRPGGFGSVLLEGTNDRISVSAAVVSAYPLTISAWFRSDSASAIQNVVTYSDVNDSNNFFLMRLRGDQANDPIEAHQDTAGSGGTASGIGYVTGRWHQAVALYAAAADRKIYLDGKLVGSNTTNLAFPSGLDTVTIGALHRSSGIIQFFNGLVDDVQIRNIALSATEIGALFDESRLGYPGMLNWTRLRRSHEPEAAAVGGVGEIFRSRIFRTPIIQGA